MRQHLFHTSLLFFLFLNCNLLQAQDGECLSGNCANGYGHFRWKSGEEYLGNFERGKMGGYGVFYWQNKSKFVGYWKHGKMSGEGLLFQENGEIKKGIWEANKLVRLTRDNFVLSPENLSHGKEQLLKMIGDRPIMKQLVQQEDLIWNWVVQKLAGEDTASPIFWQENSSKSFPIPTGVNAVHAYPTDKIDGRIWVRENISSEETWAGLIFELHNIKNGQDFLQIEEDAKRSICSKEEYILRYAKLEYKAAQEMVVFYKNIWLPYCQSKGIQPTPQIWFYYLPTSFEKWMASFTDKNGYPWHPYSGYYDKLMQEVIKRW